MDPVRGGQEGEKATAHQRLASLKSSASRRPERPRKLRWMASAAAACSLHVCWRGADSDWLRLPSAPFLAQISKTRQGMLPTQ